VTQCGWAGEPVVSASSAAASRRRGWGARSRLQDRPRFPDRLLNLQFGHPDRPCNAARTTCIAGTGSRGQPGSGPGGVARTVSGDAKYGIDLPG
jgi:hypothetical protein